MAKFMHRTHKVTIFGTDFGSAEEWSTSFWLGNTTPGDVGQSPTQAQVDGIAGLWETFFKSTTAGFSARWQTLGVKVALTGNDGKTQADAVVYSYYGTAISGGTTTALHYPPQCSLVATLTTAKPRGYGSKGRMYLPGIGWELAADGRISATNVNNTATAMKTFLDGVNALPPVNGETVKLVLQSAERLTTPAHAAVMTPITGVRIGNVYDTQRRRRNQLQEIYTAKAVV